MQKTTVSETKRRRNVKQVKRYFALHEGGNDWYEAQKKKMKEDVKALKDGGVYRNGNVSSTDGAENVLQKKKDGDTSKRKGLQKKRKKDDGNTSKIANDIRRRGRRMMMKR